jgi:putative ABC transport system permease protein
VPLRPAVFVPAGSGDNPVSFAIRVEAGTWEQTHNSLREIWESAETGAPFHAVTYQEKTRSFYQEDYRYMSLAWAFAILVVLISTLGMTGLVSFLLATRQQGLLLRKITGFPDFHNVRILFSGFFVFVALGIIFALPVARGMLSNWSQAFTVQYQVDYLCFLIPSLLMFSIAIGLARYGSWRLLSKMSLHQF